MGYIFSKVEGFVEKLKCQLKNQIDTFTNFKRFVEDELELLKGTLGSKEELNALSDKVNKLLIEIKELESFRDKIKEELKDNETVDELWQ